jgi:transposase-like protein
MMAAIGKRTAWVVRYLYLDARYEKVRQVGQVRNAAVLLAMCVYMV